MLKTNRSGFSLVEVMLLLLVLSLIISASIPMITRRNVALPQRAIHGMYLCIANGTDASGNPKYYTAIYDSKRATFTNPDAASCPNFTPPKTSGLFNIYLYGAGAGGYNRFEVKTEQTNDEKQYHMGNDSIPTFDGDDSPAITDTELGNAFLNQPVKLSVKLPGGHDGSDITAKMNYNEQISCVLYRVPGEKSYPYKEEYEPEDGASYTPVTIGNKSFLTKDNMNTIREFCYKSENVQHTFANWQPDYKINGFPLRRMNGQYQKFENVEWETAIGAINKKDDFTFKGGKGGGVSYMNYSYNIPSKPKEKTWVEWLKELKENHSKNLDVKTYGSKGSDLNIGGFPKRGNTTDCYYYGGEGEEPDYTATITTLYEKVITSAHATNGQKARLHETDSDIKYLYCDTEGKNCKLPADGQSALERTKGSCGAFFTPDGKNTIETNDRKGSCSIEATASVGDYMDGNTGEKTPFLRIMNNTYDHVHRLGHAGNRGETKTASIKNLSSDCVISVSSGGPVVTDDNKNNYNNLVSPTTITCGEYSLSANPGTPNTDIVQHKFTIADIGDKTSYSIEDVTDKYAEVWEQEVDFKKLNAFYKFNLTNDIKVGTGGNGPIIKDECIGIYGNKTIRRVYGEGWYENRKQGSETCKTKTDQTDGKWSIIQQAQPGGGGAVIIVW